MIKVYDKLPIFLQNFACSLYGHKIKKQRFGDFFLNKLQWLEESQWWNEREIENFQNEQIKTLIEYAYNKVPYYKELFHNHKLHPRDIKTRADLKKIPILTKETVRNSWEKIISNDYKVKDLIPTHTSGSTGKALEFYLSNEALQFQWAIWWRFRKRFGVDFGDLHCNFTGKIAVPLKQKKPPFWRYNKPLNQYHINMHHIFPGTIESIVDFLNSRNFVYYSGYPSIIYQLCVLIDEYNLHLAYTPKVVFSGAENLLDIQRSKIENVLHCKVTDQYGFSEACGNASMCNYDIFHEDFEFGVLECIKDEDSVGLEDGTRTGKIIATGFTNYAMPFIRYEVGDIGSWIDITCKCGRKSKTLKYINGRNEDYILTPEGKKIRRISHIFKNTKNVNEAQIVQKEQGKIIVRIVKRDEYSSKDERYIKAQIERWISPKLEMYFDYVSSIERDVLGKFKAVKSLLDNT